MEQYANLIKDVFNLKSNQDLSNEEQHGKILEILYLFQEEVKERTKQRTKHECVAAFNDALNNI